MVEYSRIPGVAREQQQVGLAKVRVSSRKHFQTGRPGRQEMVCAVHHVHCVKFHAGVQAPTTYLRQNFGVQDVSLVCEIFSVTSDEKLQVQHACVHALH